MDSFNLKAAWKLTFLRALQKTAEHDWGWIGVELPAALQKRIVALHKQIDKEDLNDEGLDTNPHITVAYGVGKAQNPFAIKALVGDEAPVSCKLGKVTAFDNPESTVLKFNVTSADLHDLNELIDDELELPGNTYSDYKPHVTIAFLKPGTDIKKYKKLGEGLTGTKFKIKAVQYNTHDDRPFEFAFDKAAMELDIEVGDTLLGGRFKNVPYKVKDIGTDDNGQPTINGMKLLSFRIAKLMPKKKVEKEASQFYDDVKAGRSINMAGSFAPETAKIAARSGFAVANPSNVTFAPGGKVEATAPTMLGPAPGTNVPLMDVNTGKPPTAERIRWMKRHEVFHNQQLRQRLDDYYTKHPELVGTSKAYAELPPEVTHHNYLQNMLEEGQAGYASARKQGVLPALKEGWREMRSQGHIPQYQDAAMVGRLRSETPLGMAKDILYNDVPEAAVETLQRAGNTTFKDVTKDPIHTADRLSRPVRGLAGKVVPKVLDAVSPGTPLLEQLQMGAQNLAERQARPEAERIAPPAKSQAELNKAYFEHLDIFPKDQTPEELAELRSTPYGEKYYNKFMDQSRAAEAAAITEKTNELAAGKPAQRLATAAYPGLRMANRGLPVLAAGDAASRVIAPPETVTGQTSEAVQDIKDRPVLPTWNKGTIPQDPAKSFGADPEAYKQYKEQPWYSRMGAQWNDFDLGKPGAMINAGYETSMIPANAAGKVVDKGINAIQEHVGQKPSTAEFEQFKAKAQQNPNYIPKTSEFSGGDRIRGVLGYLQKTAEEAVGIPSRKFYGDVSKLPNGQLIKYVLQSHAAHRAGLHGDLRFGTPKLGLYSWAVPRAGEGMPPPGERYLALQQPQHSHDYAEFEGEIPKGQYGGGSVKTTDIGQVLLTKVQPDQINFVVAHNKQPETFTLKQTQGKNWMLINTTPQESEALEAHEKQHYTVVDPEKVDKFLTGEHAGSAKIDGAAMLYDLMKDKIEAVSYRPSKSGAPIIHTYRMGTTGIDVPEDMQGMILRGEAYGEKEGRSIPVQQLSGILNSSTAKALETQKSKQIRMKNAIFDILRGPGGSEPPANYSDRLRMIQEAVGRLPGKKFNIPPTSTDPDEQRRMMEDIRSGGNPLTHEGMVFTPLQGEGKPAKLLYPKEADVYVRNIFPAELQDGEPRAGGFEYSNEPEGPVVGRVGTGFSHDTLKDMLANPDTYIGRKARIEAKEQFPSGAWRAPVYKTLHEG